MTGLSSTKPLPLSYLTLAYHVQQYTHSISIYCIIHITCYARASCWGSSTVSVPQFRTNKWKWIKNKIISKSQREKPFLTLVNIYLILMLTPALSSVTLMFFTKSRLNLLFALLNLEMSSFAVWKSILLCLIRTTLV